MALPRIGPRTDAPDVVGDINAVIDAIEQALADAQTALVGEIAMWPLPNPPAGWVVINGRLLSRTTYVDLFNVLGTAYGAGDGVTTFGLPDATDVVIMGASPAAGVGGRGGRDSFTLATTNLPSHNHTANHNHSVNQTTRGAHSHVLSLTSGGTPGQYPERGGKSSDVKTTGRNSISGTDGNHNHSVSVNSASVTTSSSGKNPPNAVDITPKHLRLNFIMYAGV